MTSDLPLIGVSHLDCPYIEARQARSPKSARVFQAGRMYACFYVNVTSGRHSVSGEVGHSGDSPDRAVCVVVYKT